MVCIRNESIIKILQRVCNWNFQEELSKDVN
jgi:hypothetical protein